MNYTLHRSINRTLPPKNILGTVSQVSDVDTWMYNDGMGDPWWEMGASKKAFTFRLTLSITKTGHSSHLTRKPYEYTGLDISPGLWVGGVLSGRSYKILSVESMADTSCILLVEDVDRRNTFNDPTGQGSGRPALEQVIIFELGDDGLPSFDPLPSIVMSVPILKGLMQLESRFRVFNENSRRKFAQLNHGFKESDILKVNPSTRLFEKANSDDFYVVGTVVDTGPGPNQFYLTPTTKLIDDLEPGLPGLIGDFIWVDNETGAMTTEKGRNVFPSYIQMTNPAKSFTVGKVANPLLKGDAIIKINNVPVQFTSDMNLYNMIDVINTDTSDHGVVASAGSQKLTLIATKNITLDATNIEDFQFKINGVLHSLSKPGMLSAAAPQRLGNKDFVRAINENTHEHGVHASIVATRLNLTSEAGEEIILENVVPFATDATGLSFLDATGFRDYNQPSEANCLKLERFDGGEITITSVLGAFLQDTGVSSVHNGKLPVALIVDKTMMASQTLVVNDMYELEALPSVRNGDQVYVQDAGDGEWALFVRTNDAWTKISDFDSAKTDASTLTAVVQFNSLTPLSLGNISPGTRVVNVLVKVTDAFNGGTAVLTIGTTTNQTAVATDQNIDLTNAGSYETSSSFMNESENEAELLVFLNTDSTVGSAKIIVSYM